MTADELRLARDAGHGGQSYLASVSDLVSALIFIFIIMLAVFAYQLASATTGLTAAHETRKRILDDIASRLEESGMSVEVVPDQGILRLSDNAINFPSGRERPNVSHYDNVGRLAQAIAEVVPCYVSAERTAMPPLAGATTTTDDAEGRNDLPAYCQPPAVPETYDCEQTEPRWLLETLLIEGHTDDVPVAPGNRFKDNIELSSLRAATVHRMITACEPRVDRLLNADNHPVFSTSGYGQTSPAVSEANRLSENRRTDLRFLMEPPEGLLQDELDIQTDVRERIGEGQL